MNKKTTKASKAPAKTTTKKRLGASVKPDDNNPSWIEIAPDDMAQEIADSKKPNAKQSTKVSKKTATNLENKKTKAAKPSETQEPKAEKENTSKSKVYDPTPDSGGASPIEYNLGNGLKMSIDSQSQFKPEYCQKLIEHMRQGDSFESFGFTIGIGRRTLYIWVQKFPLFKDAYDLAWCGCLKFYEDLFKYDTLGMKPTMKGPDGQTIELSKLKSDNLKFTLGRRFKELYAEKQEIEAKTTHHDGHVDISQLTGEALDKRQKDLESQLAGTTELITKLTGPNPLEEGNS